MLFHWCFSFSVLLTIAVALDAVVEIHQLSDLIGSQLLIGLGLVAWGNSGPMHKGNQVPANHGIKVVVTGDLRGGLRSDVVENNVIHSGLEC